MIRVNNNKHLSIIFIYNEIKIFIRFKINTQFIHC